MPACLCYSGLFRPCFSRPRLPAFALTPCLLALVCHALSACLCLDPMPASPCLHRPIPSITMCPRIIAQVAGTALQAAAHGDCIEQPMHRFVFACISTIQYSEGTALQAAAHGDCIEQPVHRFVFACVSTIQCSAVDCLAGSRTRGLHWCSPCTVCVHCSLRSFPGGA